MRPIKPLIAFILTAALAPTLFADPVPTTAAADTAARRLLADRLLNDARAAARSPLPPDLSARAAMLLLQDAHAALPDALDILHSLVEAARAAGDRPLLRDTLLAIVKLDPTDLVAQVDLLTAMAENAQAIEEQSRVYDAALAKESLDPTVRSEMALRHARLMIQRGDTESAMALLNTAVKLNDANAAAWEEIVRLQANGPVRVSDRMTAIVNCLLANPFLPSVWLAGGRALAATNQHDLAALFLGTALDGLTRIGQSSPELVLEWATELAIAGDARAEQFLSQIAKLDDAPTTALITALAVSGPSVNAPTPAADPLVIKIRAEIAASVKKFPDNKDILADAAWIEIFYMPDITPATTDYLDRFAKIVGDDTDAVKVRRGWLLIKTGKLADASALLTPLAAKDPFAQLGIARIAAEQNDIKTLTFNLQDLYNAHPTGLLALHVAADARKYKIKLVETPIGVSVRKAAAALPSTVFSAQASPRDLMLIVPSLNKRKYAFGEPVLLTLKITNTTDRPLTVGPNGAIKSSMGLAASLRQPTQQSLGLYAMDNSPRIYRLAPRGSYTQTVRLDSDRVYEMLIDNAWKSYTLNVSLITDPQLSQANIIPGIGGQVITAGEFTREAITLANIQDAVKSADALPSLAPDRQMITGLILAQLLPELADAKIGVAPAGGAARDAREEIIAALVKLTTVESPIVRAWVLRTFPSDLPDALAKAVADAAISVNPIVRLAGIQRTFTTASPADATARKSLHDELAELAATEKDPMLKDFATTLASIALVPPPAPPATSTTPASAPATAPAASAPIAPPASPPATAPASAPATGTAPTTAPATIPATTPATTPATLPATAP